MTRSTYEVIVEERKDRIEVWIRDGDDGVPVNAGVITKTQPNEWTAVGGFLAGFMQLHKWDT